MNVIHPDYLPVRPPLWTCVILWLIAAHFDYGFWASLLTVSFALIFWTLYLFLRGCEVRLPPSKIVGRGL